jgi:hypothetical protein
MSMTVVGTPKVDQRPEQPSMGIRTQVPMKGMFAVVAQLRTQLSRWLQQQGVSPAGPPFLRYHVIDMAGEMDIEVGVPVRLSRSSREQARI